MAWYEDVYAVEDGFIENWTVVPLLLAAGYAAYLFIRVGKYRTWHFKVTQVLIIVFSIFIAGEEVSWGQRIFDIESSDFFKTNNAQGETNLHNMTIAGKKVNKIIFSQMLSVCIGVYLLIFPILYKKKINFSNWIDTWGLPIPRLYQTFTCLLLFISITLIPTGKNAEVLEAGITTLFMLIFMFPKNNHIHKVKLR